MVDTGIPGRTPGGVIRRSAVGVYEKRLPQTYEGSAFAQLYWDIKTPSYPLNYVEGFVDVGGGGSPGSIGTQDIPDLQWDSIPGSIKACDFSLRRAFLAEAFVASTHWELRATLLPRRVPTPAGSAMGWVTLGTPSVTWNAVDEQLELTFPDTGLVQIIYDQPYYHAFWSQGCDLSQISIQRVYTGSSAPPLGQPTVNFIFAAKSFLPTPTIFFSTPGTGDLLYWQVPELVLTLKNPTA